MAPKLFGIEHLLYIVISTVISVLVIVLSNIYAKSEKTKIIILKTFYEQIKTICEHFYFF